MSDTNKKETAKWVWNPKESDYTCTSCGGKALEKVEWSRGCYMGTETVFSKYCPHCGSLMEE